MLVQNIHMFQSKHTYVSVKTYICFGLNIKKFRSKHTYVLGKTYGQFETHVFVRFSIGSSAPARASGRVKIYDIVSDIILYTDKSRQGSKG